MADKKEIAKREDLLPDLADYSEFAGQGLENQTAGDIQIPFLNLLQAKSPQCEPGDAMVEGAKAGVVMNSLTKELYDEILFIPAHFRRAFVEWVDRDHGGGFVASYDENAEVVKRAKGLHGRKFGKMKHPDDPTHDIVETVYLFGLIAKGGENVEFAAIPLSSSKLKPWREWNTKRSALQGRLESGKRYELPLYVHQIKITTQFEKNPKGTYFNFVFVPARGGVAESLLKKDSFLFKAGHELYAMIESGRAKIDEAAQGETATSDDGGGAF